MLKQQLRDELKTSMLAEDAMQTSVLRMLLSALNYYEINKGGANYEATDEDVLAVIQKDIKQRKDSIEQFTRAGRSELVEKETAELKLLHKYMPEQMGADKIRTLVTEAISQTSAASAADTGKVMGALMPKIKGKADGALVNQIVREELSK